MIINAPGPPTKIVNDYDLYFVGGVPMQFTLDTEAGDTINFADVIIHIHLAEKPSITDSKVMIPAEDITVFLAHLLCIKRRDREVIQLSPELQAEWKRTIQELGRVQ